MIQLAYYAMKAYRQRTTQAQDPSVGLVDPLIARVYVRPDVGRDTAIAAGGAPLFHEDAAYALGPVVVQLSDAAGACRVRLTVVDRAGVAAPPQIIQVRTDAGPRRC